MIEMNDAAVAVLRDARTGRHFILVDHLAEGLTLQQFAVGAAAGPRVEGGERAIGHGRVAAVCPELFGHLLVRSESEAQLVDLDELADPLRRLVLREIEVHLLALALLEERLDLLEVIYQVGALAVEAAAAVVQFPVQQEDLIALLLQRSVEVGKGDLVHFAVLIDVLLELEQSLLVSDDHVLEGRTVARDETHEAADRVNTRLHFVLVVTVQHFLDYFLDLVLLHLAAASAKTTHGAQNLVLRAKLLHLSLRAAEFVGFPD